MNKNDDLTPLKTENDLTANEIAQLTEKNFSRVRQMFSESLVLNAIDLAKEAAPSNEAENPLIPLKDLIYPVKKNGKIFCAINKENLSLFQECFSKKFPSEKPQEPPVKPN